MLCVKIQKDLCNEKEAADKMDLGQVVYTVLSLRLSKNPHDRTYQGSASQGMHSVVQTT